MTPLHIPVMLDQIRAVLEPALKDRPATLVDATLGLAGHASALLEHFPQLRLIGIDRDPEAIALAEQRLSGFAGRVELHQNRYDAIGQILGERLVDAVLMDLGLSSLQIDELDRGFSYAHDAPLTMRMDGDQQQLTAADVVNQYGVVELAQIFRQWGDEPHARRIAQAIVEDRQAQGPFDRSARLSAVVAAATPPGQHRSGHPAKRVFQALRMEVNEERASLETALPQAIDHLVIGGRMAVLSYHSGEDRLVKRLFAKVTTAQAPVGLAWVPDHLLAQFDNITHGALQPSVDEISQNSRARSARLRVIERTRKAAQ
ncbi:MAG: 16S rRNA (cytosine(1402)-N(4))-methyltransferase RsmH [Propionibacteriaceae bacterium]|jgi:16S rRNA (cytosine1402-N4)-methyltransferase|nr:16S rRNA (cytosine(1402)-N(4))-methyltransferase RsmH [Propionibacteriaceae bacterium]